jgi:hypothetical protein
MAERDPSADPGPTHLSPEPDRLDAWTFAAFHAALLTAVGVTALHAAGALGDLLGGLSTGLGLFLYGLLWATTYWSNRRLVERAPPGDAGVREVLAGAAAAGALTGAAFLAELVGVGLAVVALRGDLGVPAVSEPADVLAPGAVVLLAVGLAGVVGALVGLVLAGLDLATIRLVGRAG